MSTIKRDDNVMVITGRDKGKKGRVIRVFPEADRALVEKINMVKRHSKPSQQLPQGGVVEKEAAIHLSNLMVVCNKCNKPTRVGVKNLAEGKKARICRKCGEILDKEK
jgi:large subunit ribosomal protein L24